MYPTPLPPNPFAFPHEKLINAYQRCLALEVAANASLRPIPGCPPPLVCARILGHLLRLVANNNGRERLRRDITSAEDHTKLMEVAGLYFNRFIRIFKRSGPTPAPSERQSCPSFEDTRTQTTQVMQQSQLDHKKARKEALLRSDYRCMVTGRRSISHGGTAYVQAAHIIPSSTNANADENDRERFHSGDVWAMLSVFTDVDLTPQLGGNNIHCLENIVLMYEICHHLFDDLLMWFKPVKGQTHTYHIHLAREEIRVDERIPKVVTFSTSTDLPLPSDAYLALHALCCEVAWMSGAAEHITDIERGMDRINVLAHDGSTGDILASALAYIPVR